MNDELIAGILAGLAEGQGLPAAEFARSLGVTFAEFNAALQRLEASGLQLRNRAGGAIALADGSMPLFDLRAVRDRLDHSDVALDLRLSAASSNDVLLNEGPPPQGTMPVCIVEYQHGGRGRRGRRWVAPPGGSLCLSAGWNFAVPPKSPAALSLAVGVAAVRAIRAAAGLKVGLKWPNDLVHDQRKLGGILVEARTDGSSIWVVAGVGINWRVSSEVLESCSDWPRGAVDLERIGSGALPAREVLAATLITELRSALKAFAKHGFEPFVAEWEGAHEFTGEPVVLLSGAAETHGFIRGIDADGALVFETGGEKTRVIAGDISLRAH